MLRCEKFKASFFDVRRLPCEALQSAVAMMELTVRRRLAPMIHCRRQLACLHTCLQQLYVHIHVHCKSLSHLVADFRILDASSAQSPHFFIIGVL